MRRRTFLQALGGAVAAWPLATGAQPSEVRTILWVSTEAQPDPFIDGFRDGMRERGYIEGQNLTFTLRYAPVIQARSAPCSQSFSLSRLT